MSILLDIYHLVSIKVKPKLRQVYNNKTYLREMTVSKCRCKFNRKFNRAGKVKAVTELTPKKEGNKWGRSQSPA
jgi:hypothetical protein